MFVTRTFAAHDTAFRGGNPHCGVHLTSKSAGDAVAFSGKARLEPDESLKPVSMSFRIERKTIHKPDGEEVPVLAMTIDGKPWKYTPRIDSESGEFISGKLAHVSYGWVLAHDLLNHILLPWVGALDNAAGEYMAGRSGNQNIHQLLPQGKERWQATLVVGNDAEAFRCLKELLVDLIDAPDGTALEFEAEIPPPDRSFVFKGGEPVQMEWANAKMRVDDDEQMTGHPWKPIKLQGLRINSSKMSHLTQSAKTFAKAFDAYQQAIGDTIEKGNWIEALINHLKWAISLRFAFSNNVEQHRKELDGLEAVRQGTLDGGPEDARRVILREYGATGREPDLAKIESQLVNLSPPPASSTTWKIRQRY